MMRFPKILIVNNEIFRKKNIIFQKIFGVEHVFDNSHKFLSDDQCEFFVLIGMMTNWIKIICLVF